MTFSVVSKKSKHTYYLHSKEVVLAGNRKQRIYYFARSIDKEYALKAIPVGFEISENGRTGLPLLKRVNK